MRGFLTLLAAAAMTVLQVAFLSHLPSPFSDVSFPLLAVTIAIFTDTPVNGAAWALVGGLVLDLHGIFPFGTELTVMLAIFYLVRLLFRRFITNASLAAAFLLSTVIVAMHAVALLGLDGLRVLFGAEPFVLTQDASLVTAALRTAAVNGALTVASLIGWKRLRDRFAHRFIIRR